MIHLFSHNQTAYESAISLLNETGKAAVIHPTGTGKSFIGFKLCEDNPGKTIGWLSPSEYIFETQLENLKKASDGYLPENIAFFTYAKLMNMTVEEIDEIKPDYIILDEFHRCGAEMWGKGVETLLEMYRGVPILGLSATAVRYLDNQRDMSDELFDGNVASEITLGEAIVKGILYPPKYILSMFSYQQELEKYEKKVRRSRNPVVRDAAETYLEALRRTLEKADGLDDVFAKHITDRGGKYIVFCANFEHMKDMIDKAPEWFHKIDKRPKIYSVYSVDPAASQSFADFKEDKDTSHLRLLYCIDALNEGIHLDDISGVILLRPTISPIIYKQQIGRALSASRKNEAVIFDIVMNIENLYSIGAIEEEMEIAATYYRSLGEGEAIVNERFKVIDELRDCRVLFEKLENTLIASWDMMYAMAQEYYKANGNLEISSRYRTEDGYALGRWIFNQKGIRKGQIEGTLTDEQIAKLDSIGMIWGYYNDLNWQRNFAAAKAYYEANGNLDVHSKYKTEDGIPLGMWLCSLRTWERAGAHPKYLTDERRAQLEAIGMIWDKLDFYWERNYLAACEYYREHRDLNVPAAYVDKNGVRLGAWIAYERQARSGKKARGIPPTKEQIERLDKIGMIWEATLDYKWEQGFSEATAYFEKNGNLNVPVEYETQSGFKLGTWIQRQRRCGRKVRGQLSEERRARLDSIGMVWDDQWMIRYKAVLDYYKENGNISIPQTYVKDGLWLGKWLSTQKKCYLNNTVLSVEQRALIAELPLEQVGAQKNNWLVMFDDAKEYKETYGSLEGIPKGYVGKSGYRLSAWIFTQRRKYKNGELTEKQIELLDGIGFNWTTETGWQRGYHHAKAYYEEHGQLLMPQQYCCEDGYTLGTWVYKYRRSYRDGTLTKEQIEALEAIGMEWNPDDAWEKGYALARQFYEERGALPDKKSEGDQERKCV